MILLAFCFVWKSFQKFAKNKYPDYLILWFLSASDAVPDSPGSALMSGPLGSGFGVFWLKVSEGHLGVEIKGQHMTALVLYTIHSVIVSHSFSSLTSFDHSKYPFKSLRIKSLWLQE